MFLSERSMSLKVWNWNAENSKNEQLHIFTTQKAPHAFFQGPDEGKAAECLQIKHKKAFILKVGQVQNWHLREPENKILPPRFLILLTPVWALQSWRYSNEWHGCDPVKFYLQE